MYSLHESGAVIFRYVQLMILDTKKKWKTTSDLNSYLQKVFKRTDVHKSETIVQNTPAQPSLTWGHAYFLLDGSLFTVNYLQLPQILPLLMTRSAPGSSPTPGSNPVTGQEQNPAPASAWGSDLVGFLGAMLSLSTSRKVIPPYMAASWRCLTLGIRQQRFLCILEAGCSWGRWLPHSWEPVV